MIKKILLLITLVLLYTATAVTNDPSWHLPPSGPHWGSEGMAGDAEIMMVDVMVPPEGLYITTYYMTIGFKIGPRGGYCGIQNTNDTLNPTKKTYNNIFSIWDLVDGSGECRASYIGSGTNVDGFGGEGTGIHTDNPMDWKPGQWYTVLLRRWYDGGDSTCVGFYTFDHTAQKWSHDVTLVTPEADAKLNGEGGGFIENFWQENGWNPRSAYYRQNWKLLTTGAWIKPTGAWGMSTGNTSNWKDPTGRMGWELRPYGTDGIELCANGAYVSDSIIKHVAFTNTDVKPTVAVTGAIKTLSVGYIQTSETIRVNWEIDSSKGPQFTYALVAKKGSSTGEVLIDTAGKMPHIRTVDFPYIPATNNENIYLELQITDIFGNTIPLETKLFDFSTLEILKDTLTIPVEKMSVVSISSEELVSEYSPFSSALDGNISTFWHSQYSGSGGTLPYTAVIDLDSAYTLTDISFTNRQGNNNGYLKGITIETGINTSNWETSQTITMTNDKTLQRFSLTANVDPVRYVRLTFNSTIYGGTIASLAEVTLRSAVKDDAVTVIPSSLTKSSKRLCSYLPVSSGLSLAFGSPFSGTVELFSLNGRQILTQSATSVSKLLIPTKSISRSMVVMRLVNINGRAEQSVIRLDN